MLALKLGGALFAVTNIFVILAQANTVPSNTHILSMELASVFHCPKLIFVIAEPLIAAGMTFVIQYVTSVDVIQQWVGVISLLFTPMIATTLTDYWIIRRGKLDLDEEIVQLRPSTMISLLAGVLGQALCTYVITTLPAALVGLAVSFVVRLILSKTSLK